ncbi:hypothetical protein N656DRAFT_778164 [Canariomyces notabilis]|uniref:Uncharacterized protein n=1 Tax=Canariomyces notabilis TaxID=2074819 RepID=A0AAN6TFG1_9PEZI|nr:hypothetical protein N656DRAFT_778164 [Canariomyces arenarius]
MFPHPNHEVDARERSFGWQTLRAGRSNSKPKIDSTIPNMGAVKGGRTHGSTFVKVVIYGSL